MNSESEQPSEMRRVTSAVMRIASPYGFTESGVYPPTPSSMTAWAYSADTDEFTIEIERDRGGHIGIYVGAKVRRKPRAHMRGPWSLSHLRGYLDGNAEHFRYTDVDDQIRWLQDNIQSLLDTSFLNSDELNEWAVRASRRLFGQAPR